MRYLSASNAHPPSPSMAISLELWRETGHIMFKTQLPAISYIYVHKVSLGNYNILIGGMSSGERKMWSYNNQNGLFTKANNDNKIVDK